MSPRQYCLEGVCCCVVPELCLSAVSFNQRLPGQPIVTTDTCHVPRHPGSGATLYTRHSSTCQHIMHANGRQKAFPLAPQMVHTSQGLESGCWPTNWEPWILNMFMFVPWKIRDLISGNIVSDINWNGAAWVGLGWADNMSRQNFNCAIEMSGSRPVVSLCSMCGNWYLDICDHHLITARNLDQDSHTH